MSATAYQDPGVPFSIVDQQHSDQLDNQGNLVGVWRITFQTPSGIRSYVDLPDAYYDAKNVHALIADKVRKIEEVQGLGSTSGETG